MFLCFILLLGIFGITHGTTDTAKFTAIDCAKYGNGNYVFGCNNTYWTCFNLYTYKFTCFGDLVLDPDENKCNYREKARLCQNSNLQQDTPYRALELFTCKGKHDGLYSSGFCDSFYYSCQNGTKNDLPCQQEQFFDNMMQRCDFKENVDECQEDKLQPRPLAQPAVPRKSWSFPATAVPVAPGPV
uniref:Chitin-binding type-2 domain-containing protein n=1 Tax=Acrobeloides nanus TaxID=290746 RepID=A0A914E9M8_9BILA